MNKIDQSLFKLLRYIKQKDFRGYDPYDTLNSWFPFHKFGKWGPIIAIQLQKKNPINIRSLLGIKNDYNPKAMGLFLNCYSILYEKFNQNEYLEYAEFFLNWLKKKYSKGYSGYCWGYNFPYATVYRYQKPFIPSSVVTGIVSKGIFSYYKITKNEVAKNMLIGAADFVLNDLNQSNLNNGICFSYTPIQTDLCFNASLLAAEILSIVYTIDPRTELMDKAIQAVNWVINHQKKDGRWNYSINPRSGIEKKQIDFHQGYILESIFEIKNNLDINSTEWDEALQSGLKFYKEKQFLLEGCSFWRWPQKYPIEIHNQAQGIITFTKLNAYYPKCKNFAFKIAEWTIDNMQARDGHFYYRNYRFYKNKVPYMRWAQAWMFLSLSYLTKSN